MRAILLLPAALLLAACGDGDGCKDPEPSGPAAAAGGVEASAAPKKVVVATASESPEGGDEDPVPPVVSVPWRGQGDVLEFSVWHMRCDGCEAAVEKSLGKLDLGTVEADHASSVVTLRLKDASQRETAIAKVREALKGGEFRILGE